MNNKDLAKKLKQCQTGQPAAQWVARNREILLSQVRAQQGSRLDLFSKDGASFTWEAAKMFFPGKIVYRVSAVLALIFVLILGSSVTTAWADRSLPGDILYSVKITTEKVQISLTPDKEAKTKLKVEFAGKRIQEAKQISQKNDQSVEQKAANIKNSLENYKGSIKEVDSDLSDMAQQKDDPKKTVEVASMVTNQVDGFSQTLKDSQEDLKSVVGQQDVFKEAVDVSDQVADKAVNIIVEKHQSGEVVLPTPEIQNIVNQKIDSVKDNVNSINQKIGEMSVPEKSDVKAGDTKAVTDNNNLNQVETKTAEVQKGLAEAEKLLQQGDPIASLEKVQEVKQINKEVEAVVDGAATKTGDAAAQNTATGASAQQPVINTNTNTNQNSVNINTNSAVINVNQSK